MLDPDDEFVECWNEYRILMTIACSIQAVLAALAVFFIFYTPLTMHKPITGHHLHTVHTQAPNARIPPPVMTLPDKQSQIGYCRTILASELPKPTVAADRAVSWAEFLELEPAVEYPSAPIRVADTSPMAWFKDPLKGIPNRPKGVVMRLKIIEGLFAQQYPSKFRTQHGIAEHFPLPQLPILISNNEHYCFFGKEACAQANITGRRSTFSPDAHLRDLIHSILLPCAMHHVWFEAPCVAIDIGSGFGIHMASMLGLDSRVLAFEPHADLCLGSRTTVNLMDKHPNAHIFCAGIAHVRKPNNPSQQTFVVPQNDTWYGGHRRFSFELPAVPLYGVDEIVSNIPKSLPIKLVKIDTETVDCSALSQFIDLMHEKLLLPVRNFVVEVSNLQCAQTLATQLQRLESMQYTIYRTSVVTRAWDDSRADEQWNKHGFGPFRDAQDKRGWTAVHGLRYNALLWRAERGQVNWQRAAASTGDRMWQLFATLESW